MMISPNMYIKELKDKSYDELVVERENLINEMNNLDKKSSFKPSYNTVYTIYQEYLKELDKLIKNKSNML